MTQLGKYDIIQEIGKGGFGIVYKARDLSLERLVALKVLHPQLTVDSRFIENFKREARSLARINHPNVVTVHEIGELDGRLFIAMQYLPGGSLADRLEREGPLKLPEALEIINMISAGLEAGHKQGIIHRDVKPGNILFDDEGQAVIADFGVARAVQLSSLGTSTQSSGTVGTPFYRPPELWRGSPPPSPATDIYSLACVLYEMLTGAVLFSGDTPDQLITKHLLEDAHALIESHQDQFPTAVTLTLEKALAKDPQARYQVSSSFIEALTKTQDTPQPEVKVEPKLVVEQAPVQVEPVQEKPRVASKQTHETRDGEKRKTGQLGWALWTGVAVLAVGLLAVVLLASGIALLARGSRDNIPAAEPTEGAVAQVNTPIPTATDKPEPTATETHLSSPTKTLAIINPALTLGDPDWVDNMNNDDNWPTEFSEYNAIKFEDGFMKLTAQSDLDGWRVSWPTIKDFYLEATLQTPVCEGNDHFGVIFRVPADSQAGKGYLFGVTCDGRYSLRRWDGKTMSWPIYRTTHDAIQEGANVINKLGVMARGAELAFYINEQKVDEVNDSNYLEGKFGFFVGGTNVDNLSVWVDQVRYWTVP